MAVYKPTLCSPFLNGIDARIGFHTDLSDTLIKFLTCNIDTSNKNITGYKIRLLDSSNNQVFPLSTHEQISPITELQHSKYGYVENDVNSGLNGTVLKIPFFQNQVNRSANLSYNSIYYSDKFVADHIILANDAGYIPRALTNMEQAENWIYYSTSDTLVYSWPGASQEEQIKNAITLDGDCVLAGEIILLVAGSSNTTYKTGLWKATVSDSELVLERWSNISAGERVTILQGDDFHNTSWKCNTAASKSSFGVFTFMPNGGEWKDSQGSSLPNFSCNDETFKWEITLYQGNGDITSYSTGGAYITYNDVSPEWLDMTLNTGKIMGTTSERIQIGGIPYTYDSSGGRVFNYAEAVIPEGTDSDPLVLQGKYIELSSGTYPSGILSGNTRVYVKTYDATYGHAYPLSNSLDSTVAQNADYCQFFEHSNNPDDILDTDIVNYTFSTNVPITYYKASNGVWTAQTEAQFDTASVLDRRLVISTEPGTYDGINPGDLILFTGQLLPKQNGVYTYFISYDGEGNIYHCIKRAASYDTWADYIGKIIYSLNGNVHSMCNMESLAMAGAYTLWNPLSTTSGSSPLYFTPERPILLFRNRLKTNRTFTLFDTTQNHPGIGETVSKTTIDGITINVGNIIIYKDGYYGTVGYANTGGYYLSDISSATIARNDYFYILNGRTLGGLVFKWIPGQTWSENSATWDLHTAVVLHNTTTRTFISPWVGLQKTMKICLLNNKSISLTSNSKTTTKWLTINDFNDKIFYIDHPQITTVLKSEDSSDSSIPWSYDIRYFFKVSDENPFYSYETPYIRLYKNGELYSDISKVGSLLHYALQNSSNYLFGVMPKVSGESTIFDVSHFVSLDQITGRSVSLGADYKQFGESSWESYEWILYNDKHEIIQDTGKCYDKTIEVTFYGLANDGATSIKYTAELLIENDFGDTLRYSLVLVISPGEAAKFINQGSFTATMDCQTQSAIINVTGLSSTDTYSIYRREYEVYNCPKPRIEGCYCPIGSSAGSSKWGKFFTQNDYREEINIKSTSYVYYDTETEYLYKFVGENAYPQFVLTESYRIYKGEWKPVLLKDNKTLFKDFNISNKRSYQYIIYPGESQIMEYGLDSLKQTFANHTGLIWFVDADQPTQGKLINGNTDTSAINGEPIVTNWGCWSITELIPETINVEAPIMKKKYKVDSNNIWLFKYSLDTGTQTQNFNKNEIQTLGQFPKMGYSNMNTDSGSVTALLGSEIILASQNKYIERLQQSRVAPLSSNESASMLNRWKEFCFSKNPKLLKDIKGQSWIVQITSNSNTSQNFIPNVPDTINFSWKQIGSTENVVIYGDVEDDYSEINSSYGDVEWTPLYKN